MSASLTRFRWRFTFKRPNRSETGNATLGHYFDCPKHKPIEIVEWLAASAASGPSHLPTAMGARSHRSVYLSLRPLAFIRNIQSAESLGIAAFPLGEVLAETGKSMKAGSLLTSQVDCWRNITITLMWRRERQMSANACSQHLAANASHTVVRRCRPGETFHKPTARY